MELTRLELAELLLESDPDERATAIKHLDLGITEFRDMKMQPALGRALGNKDVLKAWTGGRDQSRPYVNLRRAGTPVSLPSPDGGGIHRRAP
jgi:hypothetical protein